MSVGWFVSAFHILKTNQLNWNGWTHITPNDRITWRRQLKLDQFHVVYIQTIMHTQLNYSLLQIAKIITINNRCNNSISIWSQMTLEKRNGKRTNERLWWESAFKRQINVHNTFIRPKLEKVIFLATHYSCLITCSRSLCRCTVLFHQRGNKCVCHKNTSKMKWVQMPLFHRNNTGSNMNMNISKKIKYAMRTYKRNKCGMIDDYVWLFKTRKINFNLCWDWVCSLLHLFRIRIRSYIQT